LEPVVLGAAGGAGERAAGGASEGVVINYERFETGITFLF